MYCDMCGAIKRDFCICNKERFEMITETEIDELVMLYRIKCNECEHYKKQTSVYSDLLKIKDETILILNKRLELRENLEEQLSEL